MIALTPDLTFTGGRGLVQDAGRVGDWMQTYSGRRFYPLDPRAADVDIIDIAMALGNMSRYGGHCRFYSVAEHSVMVSHAVPAELALEGLLHDATEAYITDLIRPLKRALGPANDYFKIDTNIRLAIAERFGLAPTEPALVKQADVAVLGAEKAVLHPRSDPWELPFPDPGLKIRCLLPPASQKYFLARYAVLTSEDLAGLLDRVNAMLDYDEIALRAHQGIR